LQSFDAHSEHECLAFLVARAQYHVETHGLECGPFERWWEEWWECGVCGKNYSERDVAEMCGENDASE
jgi:hypothetical protein